MLARVCETQLEVMSAAEPGLWERLAVWRQMRCAENDLRALSRRHNDRLLQDIGLDHRCFLPSAASVYRLWY